jgi:hypothetical protein
MSEPDTSSLPSSPMPEQGSRPSRGRTTPAPNLRHSAGGARITQPTDLAVVARELALQSRREQGFPDQIIDPAALGRGAQLVLSLRRHRAQPHAGVPP